MAVFAIMGTDNLEALKETAVRAKNRYYNTTGIQISHDDIMPRQFELAQNYPNPFNPGTIVSFSLKSQERVMLSIYNILGMRIADLVDEELPAGNYSFRWDGIDRNGQVVSSGIYFCRLSTERIHQTRKMVLVK